ncbi:MAG: energy-coupling factor transporter transmembrane component T [Eggerthellaceae bacterium]|jgi:energy-coupling factor transport system permease protein
MQSQVFNNYHPVVAFSYLATVIILTMVAFQPAYLALSCLGSLITYGITHGLRSLGKSLAWAVPVFLIVLFANFLFSHSGVTVLFYIFSTPFTAESLVFGACAGGMLVATLYWFSSYARCMDSENTAALFAGFIPNLSFLISHILRLLPQYLKRGRTILQAQEATSALVDHTKRGARHTRARALTVLLTWGMEDGIVRSDAMRARGYGSQKRRTTYQPFPLSPIDKILAGFILLLGAGNLFLMLVAVSQYTFFPSLSKLIVWWGYIPYIVLMLIPAMLEIKEAIQWRKSK